MDRGLRRSDKYPVTPAKAGAHWQTPVSRGWMTLGSRCGLRQNDGAAILYKAAIPMDTHGCKKDH